MLGDEPVLPAAWPYDVDNADARDGRARTEPPAEMRVAALFAVTTFSIAIEHSGLRVIEIRMQYRDGCAVWLNGFEVARRCDR